MKFQFETFGDFIAMGGHGGFVWASYAVAIMGLIFLVVSPVIGRKIFEKQLRTNAQRQTAQRQYNEVQD